MSSSSKEYTFKCLPGTPEHVAYLWQGMSPCARCLHMDCRPTVPGRAPWGGGGGAGGRGGQGARGMIDKQPHLLFASCTTRWWTCLVRLTSEAHVCRCATALLTLRQARGKPSRSLHSVLWRCQAILAVHYCQAQCACVITAESHLLVKCATPLWSTCLGTCG